MLETVFAIPVPSYAGRSFSGFIVIVGIENHDAATVYVNDLSMMFMAQSMFGNF